MADYPLRFAFPNYDGNDDKSRSASLLWKHFHVAFPAGQAHAPRSVREYRQYLLGRCVQADPEENLASHSSAGDHGVPLQICLELAREQHHVLMYLLYCVHRLQM